MVRYRRGLGCTLVDMAVDTALAAKDFLMFALLKTELGTPISTDLHHLKCQMQLHGAGGSRTWLCKSHSLNVYMSWKYWKLQAVCAVLSLLTNGENKTFTQGDFINTTLHQHLQYQLNNHTANSPAFDCSWRQSLLSKPVQQVISILFCLRSIVNGRIV